MISGSKRSGASPTVRVGVVQGGGKQWDSEESDGVVAMVPTVASGASDRGVRCFGTVIIDERHHLAAPVMNKAMRKFRAKNVIGLTATKERSDGMTPLLHWFSVRRRSGRREGERCRSQWLCTRQRRARS